jgi:type III secretion protein L
MSVKIIKNQTSNGEAANRAARRNLVKHKTFEAQAEAARVLAEAAKKAEEIRTEAERAAEDLRAQAYVEGKEKAALEFSEIIVAAHEKRERVIAEIEHDVLRLSIKLAEKIIGREMETNRETVVDIVSAALRHMRQQERLIVRVNQNDFAQLNELKSQLAHAGRANFLDLEPDPKVSPGGCIIESEVGTVDAQLETQLKILERVLLGQANVNTDGGQ